jgi:hypothetical protein
MEQVTAFIETSFLTNLLVLAICVSYQKRRYLKIKRYSLFTKVVTSTRRETVRNSLFTKASDSVISELNRSFSQLIAISCSGDFIQASLGACALFTCRRLGSKDSGRKQKECCICQMVQRRSRKMRNPKLTGPFAQF